jgi:tRNA (guanine-N7-)-methyltransferase
MALTSSHPHIRSYSGRRGHFTSGQRDAYERLQPRWTLPYQTQPVDSQAIFGRDAPLILEIGFGMGETTANIAAMQASKNFLGVEVYPAGVGALLKRIEENSLSNIRIIQHDAIDVCQHMLPPASLVGVHVFFPDPWPKARHHKRRLIRPEVVSLIASRIAPGGYLHCATDWEHYAVQMLTVLGSEPQLINTAGPIAIGETAIACQGFAPRPSYRPVTKFEARGHRLGHGVWDLVFHRR